MTKAHDYATWKALAGVRGALHGWAFVGKDKLPLYLAQGQAQVRLLETDELKIKGEELLDPIRAAIHQEA